MTKIYSAPDEIKLPTFDWKDRKGSLEAENKYLADLAEWCKKRNPVDGVGEVIKFPACDGYALYMVASPKSPVELIHIQLGDGYHFQYANRLTAKDVKEKIEQEKGMAALFGQKK
jgi:hypothetical protein